MICSDDDVVLVKVGSSNDAIASHWGGSVRDPVDASENLFRITDSSITSITASDSEIFMLSELQNNITLNTVSHEDSTQFGPAAVCLPPIDKGRDGESPSQRGSSVDGVVTVSCAVSFLSQASLSKTRKKIPEDNNSVVQTRTPPRKSLQPDFLATSSVNGRST